MTLHSNIIRLKNALKLPGLDEVVVDVVTITPEQASQWLKCNSHNRPVRRRHVAFLASEILAGNWQMNGQGIVISDDEQVLDGQHRLLAIIEAGQPIRTLVVYGISQSAFKTIDTGAVRTGADALSLHFPELRSHECQALSTAVTWCARMESQFHGTREKIGNTRVIEYVTTHQSLLVACEVLGGYPRDQRPLPLGCGMALYEMFQRKSEEQAEAFMAGLYTGENLVSTDPEYILRSMLFKDRMRATKYPMETRLKMAVKAWNWRRRGKASVTTVTAIALNVNDASKLPIW